MDVITSFLTQATDPGLTDSDWHYELPLVGSVLYILLVAAGVYRMMLAPQKHSREWFRLPGSVMQLYNLVQVVWSLATLAVAILAIMDSRAPLKIALSPLSYWSSNRYVILAIMMHYASKYIDMFDTVIIVLHGKRDQLSFLHVYHHLSIVWCWWAVRYVFRDPDGYMGVVGNSFVHALMYFYYFITARGVKVPKPIKRNLTSLQMMQFLLISVQSLYILYNSPHRHVRCPVWAQAGSVQLAEMWSLFFLFYIWSKKRYSSTPADPSDPTSPLSPTTNGKNK